MEHYSDYAIGDPVVVLPSEYDPDDDTCPGIWYVVGPATFDGDLRLGHSPDDYTRLFMTWRRVRRAR